MTVGIAAVGDSGSPYADDAAAYEAVRWARERDVPFLGTCGGLQYAVIEYFRNVLGVSDASHAESADDADAEVLELPGNRSHADPVPAEDRRRSRESRCIRCSASSSDARASTPVRQ